MIRALGRKQSSKNADWLEVYRNIERYVSLEEVLEAEERTLAEMTRILSGYKRPIYAYSAGKDSIVLAELCRKAGVDVGVMSITSLEYPEYQKWIDEHAPKGVEMVNTGQDLEWLSRNLHWFLPLKDDPDRQSPVNIRIQHNFYDSHGADIILLGRRKADGNYVGRNGSNIYTDGSGRTKYNPIADWEHELLLGYIHYKKLPLPPIYDWADGFVQGTHPWFYREVHTDRRTVLQEINEIDSTLLAEAVKVVPELGKI